MEPLRKIIQSIRDWLFPEVTVQDVPYRLNRQAKRLQVENDRRSRVLKCREMFDDDPRCEGLIDKLARDAVAGGFTIEVNNDVAQQIADDLVDRLSLFLKLDDWLVMAQRDGDLFLELSLQGNDIAAVTRKPALEMHRASDDTDQFLDPEAAYWQAEELWHMAPPKNSVWFADWQIIHARWNHDSGERYGKPQFASAVSAWKHLVKSEENVVIRRIVRAGMRLYHYVEGSWADIERYRKENQYALDNPAEAAIDFFGNNPEGPKVLQGDANLSEIEDVRHHLYTWATATPVPLHSLGYGDDLNRDVLEDQHAEYEAALPGVTEWLETNIIMPLIEMQWLLYGIFPGRLEYGITWEREKLDKAEIEQQQVEAARRKAESVTEAARAGQQLLAIGYSQSQVASIVNQMLADVEIEVTGSNNDPVARLAAVAESTNGHNKNGFLKESSIQKMEW